jgi:putative transposase
MQPVVTSDVPVRKVRPNYRSVTGLHVTRRGYGAQFESKLERDAIILLDYEPSVRKITAQTMRVGNHIPDICITTDTGVSVYDVKPESVYLRNRNKLDDVFSATYDYCVHNGLGYGLITDASIEEVRVRLDVLKQVDHIGRLEGPNDTDELQCTGLLQEQGSLSLKTLAERWESSLNYSLKIRRLCKLIFAGKIFIIDTPTIKLEESVVSHESRSQTFSPCFVIPYLKFTRRMATHPIVLIDRGVHYLENKKIALGENVFELVESVHRNDVTLKGLTNGELYKHVNLQASIANFDGDSADSSDGAFFLWLQMERPDLYKQFQIRKAAITGLALLRGRTSSDVQKVATATGMSPRNLWRLLRAYKEDGRKGLVSREFMRGKSMRTEDHRRVDRTVEAIAKEVVEEEYLTNHRKRVSYVHKCVRDECLKKELTPPSQNYLYRLIHGINPGSSMKARFGSSAYDAKFGLRGGTFGDKLFPLHTIMIDHTLMDVRLIDPLTRQPIARPWLTVGMDVFSRCIWGYILSLRQPNADTVGLLMIMGSLKKDRYVERFRLSSNWPVFGKPYQIHTDNGMDFRSRALEVGCEARSINVMRRPPNRPRYGGPLERFFRTENTEFIETLHGKTFHNTVERKRGDYDSDSQASLTIDDLEHLWLKYVVEQYHNTIHSELHTSPLEAWNNAVRDTVFEPKEPDDPEEFRKDFLSFADPDGRRSIEVDGVHFKDIPYYAPELDSLPHFEIDDRTPKRYIVRYDRADIRYLYLLDDRNGKHQYVPIIMKSAPDNPLTLDELERAREAYREAGNHRPSAEIVIESIRTMREKLKELAPKNTRALKIVASSRRDREIRDRYGNKSKLEPERSFEDAQYRPTLHRDKIRLSFQDDDQGASDD